MHLLKNKVKYVPPVLIAIGIVTIGLFLLWPSKVSNQTLHVADIPINAPQEVKGEQTAPQSTEVPAPITEGTKVTKVIDGDTIEIEGGLRVRYIGIDTPEIVHPQKPVECFGREASNKNKELVEGKFIKLEKDVSETDKYGRLLRYVFIDGFFVNQYLVKEGYAYSSSYPPDVKYQQQLREAQQEARENNRGLWNACQDQSQSISSECPIKGNISSSGEKIYHLPGQKFYEKTVIDESKSERWFCTEDEAQAAGWRNSKQ